MPWSNRSRDEHIVVQIVEHSMEHGEQNSTAQALGVEHHLDTALINELRYIYVIPIFRGFLNKMAVC